MPRKAPVGEIAIKGKESTPGPTGPATTVAGWGASGTGRACTFDNGEQYDCEFKEGKRDGKGMYTYGPGVRLASQFSAPLVAELGARGVVW